MGGSEKTLLNMVRLYGMGVPLNGALDMNGSMYIIIGNFLLKDEHEDL